MKNLYDSFQDGATVLNFSDVSFGSFLLCSTNFIPFVRENSENQFMIGVEEGINLFWSFGTFTKSKKSFEPLRRWCFVLDSIVSELQTTKDNKLNANV